MSVSSDSYFSNATVGVPQTAGDVNIWDQHASPRFALGTKFERQDGAVFRYAHFDAAISSAGMVLAPNRIASIYTSQIQSIALTSSSYAMAEEPLGIYPNNKGSRYLIVKGTGVTADKFAGGYIAIQSGATQIGHTYRIKGNTATGTPLASYFRCQLYDKLQNHIGSNSTVAIIPCKWSALTTCNQIGSDGAFGGVSILSSGTSYPFGWVLTKGVTAVLVKRSAMALGGYAAVIDSTNAGCLQAAEITTQALRPLSPVIGAFCDNSSENAFAMVNITGIE